MDGAHRVADTHPAARRASAVYAASTEDARAFSARRAVDLDGVRLPPVAAARVEPLALV